MTPLDPVSVAYAYAMKEGLSTGFVIVWHDEVSGWSRDFPRVRTEHENGPYIAGCVAVELETGSMFEARGGSYFSGCTEWAPCQK